METNPIPLAKRPNAKLGACLATTLLASVSLSQAGTIVWDGDTSTTWSDGANWVDGVAPLNNITSDIAQFSAATYTNQPSMDAGRSINGIHLTGTSGAVALTTSAAANKGRVGSGGILMDAGADTLSIGVAAATRGIRIAATQNWTNNSSSLLTVTRFDQINSGPYILTINGSGTGGTSIGLIEGAPTTSVVVNTTNGTTSLTGGNNWTGGLTLTQGNLLLGNNAALGGVGNVFTIEGGAINVNAARTTTNNNEQLWNGNFTFTGGNTWDTGTGAVTMNATRTVTVNASTMTVGGAIGDGGSGFGLTKGGAGTLALANVSTYIGNTTVNAGTLNLLDNAGLTFKIGANGVNNAILGAGTVNLLGVFTFDLTTAAIADGNSWTIVDVTNLTEVFGSTFSVNGFTETSNVWNFVDSGKTWSFSESTGVLGLTVIPEPSSTIILGLGLGALLVVRRRRAQ